MSRINTNLTANTKKFQFAYDSTKQKYGYTIDGTFYPFSSGAIYLGEYSADTTIDVSALGATSANQFLIVSDSNGGTSGTTVPVANYNWATYTAPSLTLSNGSLSVTLPRVSVNIMDYSQYNRTALLKSKVYFVGDIESV